MSKRRPVMTEAQARRFIRAARPSMTATLRMSSLPRFKTLTPPAPS